MITEFKIVMIGSNSQYRRKKRITNEGKIITKKSKTLVAKIINMLQNIITTVGLLIDSRPMTITLTVI